MQYQLITKQTVSNFLKSKTTSDLTNICSSLTNIGINCMFYARFINRIRVNALSNHFQWAQHFGDNILKHTLCFENQFHFRPGFSIDFMNMLVKTKMITAMFDMGLKNAIYLSNISDDGKHAEVFMFTTANQNNQQLLEKVDTLNHFCLSFKERASHIIQNTQLSDQQLNAISGLSPISELNITKRMEDYLICLILGLTQKQIAYDFNISQKSVEKYMDIIKDKLHCNSRHEIITKALQIPTFKERANHIIQNTQLSDQQLNAISGLSHTPEFNITKRMEDYLVCLILGLTQKQIAYDFNISQKSVEKYMDIIKNKLHCNSRHKIITKAFQIPVIKKRLESLWYGRDDKVF